MSSMQEDIQCVGSDTRPPMLDRTDFESWQQRKSTSGGIQFIGGDKLVSLSSKKQDCTSMSLAEA
ncbi:hypothetical protein Tco_0234602, partial [Tanacetum coccineum]